jgi:hypothetical protein
MVNCDQGGWWMPATLKNVFQMIVDRYIIGDLRSNRLCFAWVRDKRGFLWEVKVERPRVELPASAAPVSAAPVSAVSSAASISGRRIGESYYHVSGMQLLLPKLLSKLSPRLSKLLVRALLAAIQTRLRSCCISSASLASSSASLACSSASLACCMRVSSSNLACCIRICCARSFFLVHSSIFLS